MGVGLGDLRLRDLGSIDGDGQGRMDVRGRKEGFVLRVEVDWLESGRGLAVGIIYHWVALVVVSCSRVWMTGEQSETETETETWLNYSCKELKRVIKTITGACGYEGSTFENETGNEGKVHFTSLSFHIYICTRLIKQPISL